VREATAIGDGASRTLAESAALLGSHRWTEHQLFELTGAWAATAGTPAVRVHLFEVSHQHAWHAQLWADRLPALDGVDPEALSVPLGPALGPLLDAVRSIGAGSPPREGQNVPPGGGASGQEVPDGPDGTGSAASPDVAQLTALYRVTVPRLVVTYRRHLASASTVTDRPTIRALELVLRDETASWEAGEGLLQSLLAQPGAPDLAAGVQRTLESLVVGSGVAAGLVP
jgi:hypothetical protein